MLHNLINVVSYRVNHGRKWVSKLSQIFSKETLQFVSLTHLTQRGVGGETKPSKPSRLAAKGVFYG
jgi:hypothetical protein